jgi:hypothetical protein
MTNRRCKRFTGRQRAWPDVRRCPTPLASAPCHISTCCAAPAVADVPLSSGSTRDHTMAPSFWSRQRYIKLKPRPAVRPGRARLDGRTILFGLISTPNSSWHSRDLAACSISRVHQPFRRRRLIPPPAWAAASPAPPASRRTNWTRSTVRCRPGESQLAPRATATGPPVTSPETWPGPAPDSESFPRMRPLACVFWVRAAGGLAARPATPAALPGTGIRMLRPGPLLDRFGP